MCAECWTLDQNGWIKPHFRTVSVEFKAIAELSMTEIMKNVFLKNCFLVAGLFILVKIAIRLYPTSG